MNFLFLGVATLHRARGRLAARHSRGRIGTPECRDAGSAVDPTTAEGYSAHKGRTDPIMLALRLVHTLRAGVTPRARGWHRPRSRDCTVAPGPGVCGCHAPVRDQNIDNEISTHLHDAWARLAKFWHAAGVDAIETISRSRRSLSASWYRKRGPSMVPGGCRQGAGNRGVKNPLRH